MAFSDATTRTKFKILRVMINNNVNLADSEAVKLFIAQRKSWSSGHKQLTVHAYNEYAKMEKIQWQMPFYYSNNKLPFVPTEKEIDSGL